MDDNYYFHSIATSSTRRSTRRNLRFGPPQRATTIPDDLRLCTVYFAHNEIILESVGSIAQEYTSPLSQLKWEHCISTTMMGSDDEFR